MDARDMSRRAGSAPQVKRLLFIRVLVHCVHHSQIVGASHGVLRVKNTMKGMHRQQGTPAARKGKTAQWFVRDTDPEHEDSVEPALMVAPGC
jgi:hypothetical protein